MPFVRIDLFEGRTLEQKKALAKEVADAVVRNTGAPLSAVHVIIVPNSARHYFLVKLLVVFLEIIKRAGLY